MLGTVKEKTEQEFSPSVPASTGACIGGHNHGPHHCKKPAPLPSPILLPFLPMNKTKDWPRGTAGAS